MSELSLSGTEMMAWVDATSEGWRQLLEEHPEVLALPCDVAEVTTAGELLRHIVAVELRYAERLAELPVTDYAAIPFHSAEAIYTTHARAMELLRVQLNSDVNWVEQIEFVTRRLGPARSSRKTVFFHALLHSIRHYAQLATLVRQHGVKPEWPMDYFFMELSRA
jgi:uncharacterized damage-inducible protein DinB